MVWAIMRFSNIGAGGEQMCSTWDQMYKVNKLWEGVVYKGYFCVQRSPFGIYWCLERRQHRCLNYLHQKFVPEGNFAIAECVLMIAVI